MSTVTLRPVNLGAADAAATAPTLDGESRAWLDDLRADGAVKDAAIGRLRALLLRGARYEVARRRAAMPFLRGEELDDIATEAADDALMSVLRRLEDFRGRSRFTTWAYKFALLEAAVKLRKRAWQGREIPLEPESWGRLASTAMSPEAEVELRGVFEAVREGIGEALTPHQRRVLLALAVDGVPVDVLAERLGSTRGALYKTLHDARRKLRAHLAERGFALGDSPEEI